MSASTTVPSWQDLGLGVGLVGELWAFLYRSVVSAGEHENQGWEQHRVVKAAALVSICVGWVWEHAGLH